MAVEVDTTKYEWSHGKKPRGEGSWGFSVVYAGRQVELFWASGLYGAAKRAAVERARSLGATLVEVAP